VDTARHSNAVFDVRLRSQFEISLQLMETTLRACCAFLGNEVFDQVLFVLLTTSMWVGGMVGFFFDVTLPGTDEERGIAKWRQTHERQDDGEAKIQIASIHTYDIPFLTSRLQRFPFVRYIPFLPYHSTKGDVEDANKENGVVETSM
jgi:nucleobase transporter 1/2